MFSFLRKGLTALIFSVMLLFLSAAWAEPLTVLFTSDMHSYFSPTTGIVEGTLREHGGAGRLKSLIDANRNDHTIVVDAGDFAMGTLLQAGFATEASELRLMGLAGVQATTFGNHEFDLSTQGAADMLNAAAASGDPLPQMMIPANLDLSGSLNPQQQALANALTNIGAVRYRIFDVNGIRVAVFGLLGKNAISCAPTSGVTWKDPIASAKAVVKEIGSQADVIICISHSGTKGDGKTGEDIDMAKAVPEIDVVISGHSHTAYHNAVVAGQAVLGSPGAYLSYLGRMDLDVSADGKVTCLDYRLLPCDGTVTSDETLDAKTAAFYEDINETYLADSGFTSDQVIAHSSFTLPDVETMYADTNNEHGMSQLIADSYLWQCKQVGVDADVAFVALGTVRSSIREGDISVADAFEICSLGVGSDGSAGHPLVAGYLYGWELKLFAEADAFLGESFTSSFRIDFAGLEYTCDVNRVPLDRTYDLHIRKRDGTLVPLENNKLYRVVLNMYAVNMIAGVCQKLNNIFLLTPRDASGTSLTENFYSLALRDENGREVKEWEALRNYLVSLPKVDGVSEIPTSYRNGLGRKVRLEGTFPMTLAHPGLATIIVIVLALLVLRLVIVVIGAVIRPKKKK